MLAVAKNHVGVGGRVRHLSERVSLPHERGDYYEGRRAGRGRS